MSGMEGDAGGSGARGAHLLNAVLLILIFGYSASVYESLPDGIPAHYGADGTPDRWVEKTLASWFLLPGVSLVLTGLLYGVGGLVALLGPKRPAWVNVPARKAFLLLSAGDRQEILGYCFALVVWMAVPLNVLMLYSQWVGAQVARKRMEGLSDRVYLGIIGCVFVVAIAGLIRVRQRIQHLSGRGAGRDLDPD